MTGEVGTIYLLHFDPPYKHAKHYIGWARDHEARFDRHVAGRGSPLVKAAVAAGCEIVVAMTKPGTRDEERLLHRRRDAPHWCPICKEKK